MKVKILLLILLLMTVLSSWADTVITEEQDVHNKKYLILLNDNLLNTINMLQAFNNQAKEIYLIEKGDVYNSILMDLTMQCSNLIDKIRQTELMDPLERDLQVRALIATIKPDVEFSYAEVEPEIIDQNRNYLKNVSDNLDAQIKSVFKAILEEEKIILDVGEVTDNYLRLHSHHFIFSLLEDFVLPSEYLSPVNEDYLVKIVQSIDDILQNK